MKEADIEIGGVYYVHSASKFSGSRRVVKVISKASDLTESQKQRWRSHKTLKSQWYVLYSMQEVQGQTDKPMSVHISGNETEFTLKDDSLYHSRSFIKPYDGKYPIKLKGTKQMATAKKKTAKKKAAPTVKINKAELIRSYKSEHPEAMPAEIAEKLAKQTGETFTAGAVSTALFNAKKYDARRTPGYDPGASARKGWETRANGKPATKPRVTSYKAPKSETTSSLEIAANYVEQCGSFVAAREALDKLESLAKKALTF